MFQKCFLTFITWKEADQSFLSFEAVLFFFLTLALPTLMLGLTLPIHMGFYLQQHGLGRNFVNSCPYRLKMSKLGIRFRKMSFP